jgi:hypothetical protein
VNLEEMFGSIVERGWVPLPNFLREPDGTAPVERNLLVVSRRQLHSILTVLSASPRPFGKALIRYAEEFTPTRFDARRAAAVFRKVTADPATLGHFNRVVASLYAAVRSPSYRVVLPMDVRPLEGFSWFRPLPAREGHHAPLRTFAGLGHLRHGARRLHGGHRRRPRADGR